MRVSKLFSNVEARERLYLTYLTLSVLVVVTFVFLFTFLGYYTAAIIQALVLLPFGYSVYTYMKGFVLKSKAFALGSSLMIVLIQNNYVFTPSVGFHFMLIPLLVVQFLISDIGDPKQKRMTFLYSFFTVVVFFISSELSISSPIFETGQTITSILFNLSMTISFIALFIMLYVYSMQLSIKEKALSYYADYDALTDIYNRGYFNRNGEQWFPLYSDESHKLAVIIFDIDDFKRINDTYGHPVGDTVLVALSKAVTRELPPSAIFSRYGGEEFAVLIKDASLKQGYAIAELIRKTIENTHVMHHDKRINFTVSVGLAVASYYHNTFDDVIRDADRALYKAKHKGKNRTLVVNTPSAMPVR